MPYTMNCSSTPHECPGGFAARDSAGRIAVPFIVITGILAFVLLFLASRALERSVPASNTAVTSESAGHRGAAPDDAEYTTLASVSGEDRYTVERRLSPFDGERAMRDVERVVGYGPRPAGSAALAELREHIRGQLDEAGVGIREQAFTASTPIGDRDMVNVVGVVQGDEPGIIVLGNHYDTKYYEDIEFVGANDGGSTTAWMMEMARVLGPEREGRTVWLCFFDGEEAFEEWTDDDSLYGSREFVRELEATGEIGDIDVMINVDMIGDCVLTIQRDAGAPRWLSDLVWDKAEELGYGEYFLSSSHYILDDHIPFRRAGVPAMVIIDFMYGGTRETHRRYWHTEEDTLDKVCARSLQAVGDVIYHALPDLEAQLDGMMTP